MPKISVSKNLCHPPRNSLMSVGPKVWVQVLAIVLGAAQVVALVVAPERDAGFVGVVENIASGERIPGGEVVVDARVVVVLFGDGARRRAGKFWVPTWVFGSGMNPDRSAPAGSGATRE